MGEWPLHIEKLKMQLAVLRRARFGRSSEKADRDIEQLELPISGLEEDVAAQDARANDAAAKTDPYPSTSTTRSTPASTMWVSCWRW